MKKHWFQFGFGVVALCGAMSSVNAQEVEKKAKPEYKTVVAEIPFELAYDSEEEYAFYDFQFRDEVTFRFNSPRSKSEEVEASLFLGLKGWGNPSSEFREAEKKVGQKRKMKLALALNLPLLPTGCTEFNFSDILSVLPLGATEFEKHSAKSKCIRASDELNSQVDLLDRGLLFFASCGLVDQFNEVGKRIGINSVLNIQIFQLISILA